MIACGPGWWQQIGSSDQSSFQSSVPNRLKLCSDGKWTGEHSAQVATVHIAHFLLRHAAAEILQLRNKHVLRQNTIQAEISAVNPFGSFSKLLSQTWQICIRSRTQSSGVSPTARSVGDVAEISLRAEVSAKTSLDPPGSQFRITPTEFSCSSSDMHQVRTCKPAWINSLPLQWHVQRLHRGCHPDTPHH